MPCCGKGREQLRNLALGFHAPQPAPATTPLPRRIYYSTLYFEYVGNTALTVVSPRTGRRYRFDHPGAKVEIDLRDRPWLASVPHLRQVPS
jgi:hypothetical protein